MADDNYKYYIQMDYKGEANQKYQRVVAWNILILLHTLIFQALVLAGSFNVKYFFINLFVYFVPLVLNALFLFGSTNIKSFYINTYFKWVILFYFGLNILSFIGLFVFIVYVAIYTDTNLYFGVAMMSEIFQVFLFAFLQVVQMASLEYLIFRYKRLFGAEAV